MTYVEKILKLRESKGLSVDELAAKMGKDGSNLHPFLTGKRNAHLSTKKKLADIFGVTIQQLFDDSIELPNLNLITGNVSGKEIQTLRIENLDLKGTIASMDKITVDLAAQVRTLEKQNAELHATIRAFAAPGKSKREGEKAS